MEPNRAAGVTTDASGTDPREKIFGEIVAMLRDVTGEDEAWAGRVGAQSRLDGDLMLESFEWADLHTHFQKRFDVDLLGFLTRCDLDEIIDLRVADLVALAASA